MDLTLLQKIAVWAVPVLFAITVHETMHGWMAWRLGDPTARMLGRLSLNPVRHIDPVGTILVPGLLLTLGGFLFGWAKPVPVTWENLKKPKRDMALVAIAGPLSNLFMALVWALLMRLVVTLATTESVVVIYLLYLGIAGILINSVLMVLNLLPLPPLDGGRVVAGLLPGRYSWQFSRLEPYGLPILIVLMVTGVLSQVIGPPVMLVMGLMTAISGLSANSFYLLFSNLSG
ncbi:MAG: site-2 protease family protein [Gammaproteobacteria bacterium]|nr:site-2 protease family protein [Gammaproteobacteria bacterium]